MGAPAKRRAANPHRLSAVIGAALAACAGATVLQAEPPTAAAQTVIASLDLTAPFATRTPWRLVATQGPPDKDFNDELGPGAVRLCLTKGPAAPCAQPLATWPRDSRLSQADWDAHDLDKPQVVRATGAPPLLRLRTASRYAGDGDQVIFYQLLAYRRGPDRFEPVYAFQTGHNNNQEVRFVEAGPLAGAVISVEPTQNAPFGFWVIVNRMAPGGAYRPVLRYRSATHYGDGNPLAVIDSEMPNILQRLRLWRPGQPLPLPAGPCPRPRLVKGALWCA